MDDKNVSLYRIIKGYGKPVRMCDQPMAIGVAEVIAREVIVGVLPSF